MVLLNSFYADARTLEFPELIELCADKDLTRSPILSPSDSGQGPLAADFQRAQFEARNAELEAELDTLAQPVINENSRDQGRLS